MAIPKNRAEKSVRRIKAFMDVTNRIQVKPQPQLSEIKNKIMEAFRRNAEIDANRIEVETHGGDVILKGKVRSWIDREETERVVWSAPGVTEAEDRIVVAS